MGYTSMIPLQKYDYAFPRGNLSSLITVDFYIDLTCSSCLDAWPTLTNVVDEYKDQVRFMYRVFPLPYHQQAFILAKAAQVVNYYGAKSAIFTFMDTAYALQPQIYNSATSDMTYNQVVRMVSNWATKDTGVSTDDYFIGMNSSTSIGSTIEMSTRYMWKYSCLKDIFATPLYIINGVEVEGLDTFEDWKSALDPLLA
eukprot:CAMPEP_0201104706 /NCGR_PEP_ID=MMETSP0812-20130820/40727_1 /ASSEMBLY_ACC=CAM_ASM_000668 /TAXON_ID=98059 /ORGANISM="Dinobryon sp., Strain UTEXLB2267" /LENGTH=197 /DNA_ID=CAMNT_0047364065 /DNA_START=17 /DNA_END=610 /DNA_ORIENTATION=+